MLKENEWNTINSMLIKIYEIKDFEKFTSTLLKMFRMLIPYSKGYFLVFDENDEIDKEKSYFIEMRWNVKKDITIILNNNAKAMEISLPDYLQDKNVVELLNNKEIILKDKLRLEKYGYFILKSNLV